MKKTRKEAHEILYSMWENGELPSNFTEDHSHYEDALLFVMKHGYLEKYLFVTT
jgi:hypothetical protein